MASYFQLIYTIFSVAVTVCGNGLIILCWIFDSSVRTSSNALLVTLALFDFITGAFVTPVMYATDFFNDWTFGKVPCQIYVMFIYFLFILVSNTLVLIAVDRYRILVEGVPYIQRRSPLTALKPVCLVMFVAFWVQIDAIVDFENAMIYTKNENNDGSYRCVRNYRPTFGLLVILFDTILPAICLVFINLGIYRELRKRHEVKRHRAEQGMMSSIADQSVDSDDGLDRKITKNTSTLDSQAEDRLAKAQVGLNRQKSAAVTLTILTVAFIVLLLPYAILNLSRAFFGVQLNSTMTTITAYSVWANSLINPFVYAIRCNDFKQSLIRLKQRIFN